MMLAGDDLEPEYKDLCEISESAKRDIFLTSIHADRPGCDFHYVSCRDSNVFYFSGPNSPFTPSYNRGRQLYIDGEPYASVHDYVWKKKFYELTSNLPPEEGSSRTALRLCGVDSKENERWILHRGLLYLQKAILAKVRCDENFRIDLTATGSQIMVYCFIKDTFFGSGEKMQDLQSWFEGCCTVNVHFKYPRSFPLVFSDLACTPRIGLGYNVLGTIYMALREKLRRTDVTEIEVDIPAVEPIFRKPMPRLPQRHSNPHAVQPRYNPYPSRQVIVKAEEPELLAGESYY